MTKQELANKIASQLHEDWRKTRLREDGTYEPRWKATKSANFDANLDRDNLPTYIRVNEDGSVEIDIANCSYENLSPAWQAENKAAAEVVADILAREAHGERFSLDEVGAIIHDQWLLRNDWAKGGDLDKPFADLPKVEQDKDLDQYRIGLEELGAEKIVDEPVKTINPDGEGK